MSNHKLNNSCYKITVVPPNNNCIILKADIGASKHYVKPEESHIMHNRKKTMNGPRVSLPGGSVMETLETDILPLNNFLSTMAKTGNVLAGLTNSSLLSIG